MLVLKSLNHIIYSGGVKFIFYFSDCQDKCKKMYLEACGSVIVPTQIVPKHLQ